MPMNTTLNKIRAYNPCKSGWKKLLTHLNKTEPDNEVLNLSVVVESNGLADAMWCMRSLEDLTICSTFARMCADSVQGLNNYYSKHSDAAATAAAVYDAADARLKQQELNKQFFLSLC